PDTWITTSRADGTGSGIRIFRVPEGVHWRSKLFDNEGNDGNIEIIQHGHRYVMVWPSVHPKTKQIYTWYGPGWTQALQPPRPRDFAALPQAWVNYLAMGAPRRVMDLSKLDRSGSDAESFFKDDRRFTWKQFQGFIEPHMTRLINAPTGTINNTLNDACKVLSHFVPQFIDWETAEGWIWDALGRNKDYDGEAQKTSGTIESGFGSTVEKGDWIAQRVEETEQTKAEGPLPSYPASFWESRKVFAHIRQAAHHRGRSGDLVLAATLVRLSAMVSPRLRFDIGLGPASLNLGAVAIGGTGTGKSSGSEVAKTMIDAPNYLTTGSADLNEPMKFLDMAAVGSGEGIAEVFWGSKLVQVSKAKNGEPKMQMVRQRIRENVFFFVDEGQTMMKQAERNGTTIGGTLRNRADRWRSVAEQWHQRDH
ncbi:MAG: bifunctional DNA primase/polymerase, partial [Candidatus Dormibacteraceae bacterium]